MVSTVIPWALAARMKISYRCSPQPLVAMSAPITTATVDTSSTPMMKSCLPVSTAYTVSISRAPARDTR